MPSEGITRILELAKEERAKGCQVLVSNMKKNKKFQKEQLAQEGYEEIEEFFVNRM